MDPAEVNKELGEMLQALEGNNQEQEPPAANEPVEEPPVEPVAPVEPAAPDAPVEPPVEEPPVASVEPPVEAPVELDLAAENDKLRLLLNEMARKVRAPGAPPPKSDAPVEPAAPAPVQPSTVVQQALAEFITDEDADLLIDRPKEVLLRFGQRIAQSVQENILRSLPGIVGPVASHQVQAMQKAIEFYTNNKDLEQYKDFCILTATQIETEHPDWNTEEIYEETAKVARARLGLKKEAEQQSAPSGVPSPTPALPGGRASRKPTGGPVLSKSQEDMVDMLGLL